MTNQNVAGRIGSLQPSLEFQSALQNEKRADEITPAICTQFFDHLDAVFAQNTRQNIQTCTEWILKHMAPSGARTTLLGKYLVSLSDSIVMDGGSGHDKATRNRLDLVLVMSDVLHAVKFHQPSEAAVSKDLHPYIKELVALAACCCHDKHSKHETRLKAVIKFWFANMMFDTEDISDIMESARNGLRLARGGAASSLRERNDTLPAYFGESNALEYDLPTSYVLLGNPRRNWRGEPSGVKSQKLPKHPSRKTTDILDAFFERLDGEFRPTGDNPLGGTGGYKQWTDAAGHPVTQHKTTSSTKKVSNGLGWSMDVCRDMKEEGMIANVYKAPAKQKSSRMDLDGQADDNDARTRHYDSDGSRSPRRRRYSSSDSGYDQHERRRDERSLSRSSFDSRDGRPPLQSGEEDSRDRHNRPQVEDRNRDDGRHPPRISDREMDHPRHAPPAPSPYSRDSAYSAPNPQQGYAPSQEPPTAPPNFQHQPPHFPGHFPPQFPGQLPGQLPPGQFPGQMQGQPSSQLPQQFSGPFPGQFLPQFPMPPFNAPFPGFPGAPPPNQPGPPNLNGFPNGFPPMGGAGYPNQPGGNANFGHNVGYGGFNRGGFRGNNNFNPGSGFRGNNQRGRGGGSNWN